MDSSSDLLAFLEGFEPLPADLGLFDGLALDAAACAGASPSPTPTRPRACSRTRRAPRRAYCHSVREEKLFLRARVAELESQRVALLAELEARNNATPWRQVALRQQQKRARAELENTRLRAELQQLVQTVRSLEALAERCRPRAVAAVQMDGDKSEVLVDQFLGDISRAYDRLDEVTPAVSEDAGFESSYNAATMRSHTIDGRTERFAELRHTFRSPFAFHRVVEATWEAITTEYSRQNREITRLRASEDVYAATFDFVARGTVVLLVLKRFVEPGRFVVVWRAVERRLEQENELPPATGWLVVRPSGTGVIGHVCSRIIPDEVVSGYPLPQDFTMLPSDGLVEFEETKDEQTVASSSDIFAIAESMESLLITEQAGRRIETRDKGSPTTPPTLFV